MSRHNGLCDTPGCADTATHHGPQFSACEAHRGQTVVICPVCRHGYFSNSLGNHVLTQHPETQK